MNKQQYRFDSPRLRPTAAADYLGVSDVSLNRSRCTGELMGTKAPRYIKVGDAKNSPVVYPRKELDRWVAQFELQGTTAENPPRAA